MSIPKCLIAILACCPSMFIHGQQNQVSSPVAGYVFDGVALRPIAGVPGGATLGGALDLALAPNDAAISPSLDSVIVTAADGSLHLFRLNGNRAAEVSWNGVSRGPAQIVYSPSGTAAAIYASRRIQVVKGLPDSPVLAFAAEPGPSPKSLTRLAGSPAPQAVAVSDDAGWLLLATEGRVRAVSSSGASSVLLEGTRGVSVAFAPGSHTAAVLNAVSASRLLFDDVSQAPNQARHLPTPGFTEPAGLAFAADGKAVVAADRTARSVRMINFGAGAATMLECACAPTAVARMGNLFRLTDAGSGPVWLVDAGVTPPRIAFVPALAMP